MQVTSNNGIMFQHGGTHTVNAMPERQKEGNDAWPRTFANSGELVDCIAADRGLFMCVMMAISDTIQSQALSKKRRLNAMNDLPMPNDIPTRVELPVEPAFSFGAEGEAVMEVDENGECVSGDDYARSFAISSTPHNERPHVEADKPKPKSNSGPRAKKPVSLDATKTPKATKPRAKAAKMPEPSVDAPPEVNFAPIEPEAHSPSVEIDTSEKEPTVTFDPIPAEAEPDANLASPSKKPRVRKPKPKKTEVPPVTFDPIPADANFEPPSKPRVRKPNPKKTKVPPVIDASRVIDSDDEHSHAPSTPYVMAEVHHTAAIDSESDIGNPVISEEKPRKQKVKKRAPAPTPVVTTNTSKFIYLDECGDEVDQRVAMHRVDAERRVYDICTGMRVGRYTNGVIVPM